MNLHQYRLQSLMDTLVIDDPWTLQPREQKTPEDKLLFSLLHDSIKQFLRGKEECRRWILERGYGRSSVMTFNYICEHFGIDPSWLRAQLVSMTADKRALSKLQMRPVYRSKRDRDNRDKGGDDDDSRSMD